MIMGLLISLLDSKFVLTHESHISLDWKFQSLLTYTPSFVHATLQFLGSTCDSRIEWPMLSILVLFSTISMLTTMSPQKTNLHKIWQELTSSALVIVLEDIYNMDEIGSFYCAQQNMTLSQGKVCGRKIQKDCLTLALAINTTSIEKLKSMIFYKSLRPRCSGRRLSTNCL